MSHLTVSGQWSPKTGIVPKGLLTDSTIQETYSQAAHAVDSHYSSCWQAIYTKVIQHRQKLHTKQIDKHIDNSLLSMW